jgi:hypothetical protein
VILLVVAVIVSLMMVVSGVLLGPHSGNVYTNITMIGGE